MSFGDALGVFSCTAVSLGVTTFVIWAADPSKRTLDDVITAVEALHDTGKLDGSGKTEGFASECPLAPLDRVEVEQRHRVLEGRAPPVTYEPFWCLRAFCDKLHP